MPAPWRSLSARQAVRRRRRVVLTFSTTVMGGQTALINRVCEAVGGLDARAVLTLGPAVARDAVQVPDSIEVVAFADHDRLMPAAAAVIGHGGLGTVLRALAHGVPQLLLPLGRDQAFNADRVEHLGAGIRLPTDAPPGRIQAAVHELLTEGDSQRRLPSPHAGSPPTTPTGSPARRWSKPLAEAALGAALDDAGFQRSSCAHHLPVTGAFP